MEWTIVKPNFLVDDIIDTGIHLTNANLCFHKNCKASLCHVICTYINQQMNNGHLTQRALFSGWVTKSLWEIELYFFNYHSTERHQAFKTRERV